MKPKTIHVVSNSHWDREWVYPFEETRLLLLDFMDNLLDLLDRDPDFHSFTMDSQTLCVEDYLELRPEKRATVEQHVKSGRLIVGPWYSLPEEYCVNGESLVRNLLVGHQVAESYGRVSKIGYTPFSYGQTSQIPQMYWGFGIDNIIFYRGINTPKSEFIWEGADGTRLLGMRFGTMSRFSYYIYVYRVLRYGSDDVWARYDWDRGAAPFRLADAKDARTHYYVLDKDKKQWNTGPIQEQLRKLVRDEAEHFTTDHICCMQGFDTSDPDPKESEIIKLCQDLLPEHTIKLSSLEEYMAAMKAEVKNPAVITGESRDPGSTGKWTHLYGDVISARVRLKLANHRSEVLLQRMAEPWSAVGLMVGGEYVKTALDKCWKLLLQNHPHDTISGAGTDQMEKDSLFRFDQINLICEGLSRRGMQAVQIQIDNSDLAPGNVVMTVFNSCPFPRRGVVSCYLDMPDNMGYEAFTIHAPGDEQRQRVQVRQQYPWGTLVRNLQDISIELRSTRVLCHVELDEIPAYGYKTYHLVRTSQFPYDPGTLVPEANVLENEHLRAEFNADGTINLTHKESGRRYEGIHYLEDTGETGHTWVHMEPDRNETITSHGFPCSIQLEESGPLLARMRVDYYLQIPAGLTEEINDQYRVERMDHTARSPERRLMLVSSRFTLRAGSRRLEVTTTVDNPCRNHRLRVVFPTRLKTDQTHAEVAFDVVARDIPVKPTNAYYAKPNPQYPMYRFVDMTDGTNGFAVLNTGLREYEAMDTAERPLAITLFRAFVYRNCPVFGRYEVYPEMELAQCIGKQEFTYALYPHPGDWTQGVHAEAEDLNLPLAPAQAGPHAGTLPKQASFFELQGDTLQITAFKKCETRETFIVRIFNPTDQPVGGKLIFRNDIRGAWRTNMNEEREEDLAAKGGTLTLNVGRKKIVTVEVDLAREL